MKVLVRNENHRCSSETIEFNGKKFKIVARNGNCYSELNVYTYTLNGDIALVADKFDIPNYEEVNFVWKDEKRLEGCVKNIAAAEKYIEMVWGKD